MNVKKTVNGITIVAYQGDAATLLAFDLTEPYLTDDFVGFTIIVHNPLGETFPLMNKLDFTKSTASNLQFHSTVQAPLQMFHWVHLPGNLHGAINDIAYGNYTYDVTPRYWDTSGNQLKALDNNLTVSLTVAVKPFEKGAIQIGFTRGFMVSQAYVTHFGNTGDLLPKAGSLAQNLQANLATPIPTSPKHFTYADQHEWLGFNALKKILAFLDEVAQDATLTLDVFAYDLNLPEVVNRLLAMADPTPRVRIILDDSSTHAAGSEENDFEQLFVQKAGQSAIQRGHFSRLAHDKIFILRQHGKAIKVLTGSTNFALNGVFINANHVVVINDEDVAKKYADVFDSCFTDQGRNNFKTTALANQKAVFQKPNLPKLSITFSPHTGDSKDGLTKGFASTLLDEISQQITDPGTKSVFFAVMDLSGGGNLISTLETIQNSPDVFSYGVTDSTTDIHLYHPGENKGILVTGKASLKGKIYPPPFKNEVNPNAHKIHHKFVILNFNTPQAKVYCGSSNLSLGGEQQNGDNLLLIEDEDVATVFAIEALRLIEHYELRNRIAQSTNPLDPLKLKTSFQEWGATYSDPTDYHFRRRKLLVDAT